jgi:GNAT superfamily N-acetyltransferase
MNIEYTEVCVFSCETLQDLFLSVGWDSGKYPDKLVFAMKNYGTVFSAWDGDKLVGLIASMDDGVMTAYIHYLLVNPDYQHHGIGKRLIELTKENYRDFLTVVLIAYNMALPFYEICGFKKEDGAIPMYIKTP